MLPARAKNKRNEAKIRRTAPAAPKFVRRSAFYRPNAEKRFLTPRIFEMLESEGRIDQAEEQDIFAAMHYCAFRIDRALRAGEDPEGPEVRRWRELHARIRDRLVDANLGLVYDLVRRTRFTNVETDELVSDGLLALLQAVDAFNPWKGYRFSTYACNAILRAFIRRSMTETRRRERIPVQFEPELERGDWPSEKREQTDRLYAERLARILESPDIDITETERYVLSRRFPADPDRRRDTLEEIGKAIQVSKERVRQIQNAALQKLREALQADPVLQ